MEPIGTATPPSDSLGFGETTGQAAANGDQTSEQQLAQEFTDFFIDSELLDIVLEDDNE